MTESTRERMARIVWQLRWGFDFDKAAKVADTAPVAREMIDEVYATVDAILDVLAEPSNAVLKAGDDTLLTDEEMRAGPYELTKAEWRAMIAAIREGK